MSAKPAIALFFRIPLFICIFGDLILARLRVAAEQVNRRLKIFRILAERNRNRRRRFGLRFNLIAAILNFELATSSG